MADKAVDKLVPLFHDRSKFVHMGGTWKKNEELDIIKSGRIWYKQAARCSWSSASSPTLPGSTRCDSYPSSRSQWPVQVSIGRDDGLVERHTTLARLDAHRVAAGRRGIHGLTVRRRRPPATHRMTY